MWAKQSKILSERLNGDYLLDWYNWELGNANLILNTGDIEDHFDSRWKVLKLWKCEIYWVFGIVGQRWKSVLVGTLFGFKESEWRWAV